MPADPIPPWPLVRRASTLFPVRPLQQLLRAAPRISASYDTASRLRSNWRTRFRPPSRQRTRQAVSRRAPRVAGRVRRTTGRRARTSELVVLIPRRSGKTTLLAAIAVHHLATREDAQVYAAAASRAQAAILFEPAVKFTLRLDEPHPRPSAPA